MQPMQQQPQPREPSILLRFCQVAAFIIAVLFAPDLHELTRDYISTKITANYGEDFTYYGLLAWYAGLFGLVYYGLTFLLQTIVTFANTLFYTRHF